MLHHNHQHHGQQRTPTQTNISNINSNNLQFYNKPYPLISIESQQQPVKNIINHSQSQNAIVIQQTSASSISPIKLDQSVIDYDSDESTDSEDASSNKKSSHHIYVTFDVPTQAARLLKKFASENFHRLNEIGIKSVKLKNEPTIKVSKKQEVFINFNYIFELINVICKIVYTRTILPLATNISRPCSIIFNLVDL